VAICFFIGGIETLSLIPYEFTGLSRTRGFWGFLSRFNLNTAGFVIVAMFLLTWLAALLIWRYGHIEDKWSARLQSGAPEGAAPPVPSAAAGSNHLDGVT
jgi:nickel/cobalt transporter (NiCoT) family protein